MIRIRKGVPLLTLKKYGFKKIKNYANIKFNRNEHPYYVICKKDSTMIFASYEAIVITKNYQGDPRVHSRMATTNLSHFELLFEMIMDGILESTSYTRGRGNQKGFREGK